MSPGARSQRRRERLIAGIDEAGYGPLLGPMTVSACMVAVPQGRDPRGRDLWDALARCVRRPPGPRPAPGQGADSRGRILVGDSKLLFTPRRGYGELERAVLALVGWGADQGITGVEQLLGILLPPVDRAALSEAWQRAEHGRFPLSGAPLPPPLAAPKAVRPRFIASRLLPAQELNRRYRATPNKATVAWAIVAGFLRRAWDEGGRSPQAPLTVVVDRQGGRTRYGDLLQRAFPGAFVWTLEESAGCSAYRVQDGRFMEVSFHVRGDDLSWPVAVASMVSKYLRELMMVRLNGYFADHCTDVKPTAGYYTDAKRFLRQTERLRARLGITDERFVRSR